MMERPTVQAFRPDAAAPRDGVRVLDFSRLVAGNMLTLQVADFGADVIKLEPASGAPCGLGARTRSPPIGRSVAATRGACGSSCAATRALRRPAPRLGQREEEILRPLRAT